MESSGTVVVQLVQSSEGLDLWQFIPAALAAAAAIFSLVQVASSRRADSLRAILQRVAERNYHIRFWDLARLLGYSARDAAGRLFSPTIYPSATAGLPWTVTLPSRVRDGQRVLGDQATPIPLDSASEAAFRDLLGPGFSDSGAADFVTFYDAMLQLAGWTGVSKWPSRAFRRVARRPAPWTLARARQVLLSSGTGLAGAIVTHRYLAAHIVSPTQATESARKYRAAYGVTDSSYADLAELMVETVARLGWAKDDALEQLRERHAWVCDEASRVVTS